MRQQRQPLLVVQRDDEAPKVRHVTRHPLGPSLARLARARRQRRVLDPFSMASQGGHGRTNLKATGLGIAVEQLRGQRVGERDQRHVGPLAKRHAKRQRPIGRQVASEAVGNRLAGFLVLDLLHVFVAVLGLLVLPGPRVSRVVWASGSGCGSASASSSSRTKPRSILTVPSW